MKPSARLLLGDCREVLATLEPNSIDSIVCDPPYGLSGEPDIHEVLRHWLAGDTYEHSSAGFMGKSWDSFVPGPRYWEACFRVLKPGGHLVAFSSTRTEDLLGIAIRLAGFKRRDLIAWLYWTGFPHGINIGKEFDRMRDDKAEILKVTAWIASARDEAGLKNRAIDEHFGFDGMAGHWTTQRSQATVPRPAQWRALTELLDVHVPPHIEELVDHLNGRKGTPGEDWAKREVIGTEVVTDSSKVRLGVPGQGRARREVDITASHSEEAKIWEGWGTLLKPAIEPALLFQKPISEKSITMNVRKWGTGGLNLDACRYALGDPAWPGPQEKKSKTNSRNVDSDIYGEFGTQETHQTDGQKLGRYPANIYVCKKPDEKEKERGCDHLPRKSSAELVNRVEGSAGKNNPRAGAGRSSKGRSNTHATVKPVRLMAWLCRLLTPPGGTVLDPFLGSGTTGVAAIGEGFHFVGIEKEKDYLPIAVARIDYASTGAEVEAPDGMRTERVQRMLF